jgi:hypothetical protein
MKIQVYNSETLQLEQDDATGVDFGTVYQGNPSDKVCLIKPARTIENNFLQLSMFLQDSAGLGNSQYRYLLQDTVTGTPDRNELTGTLELQQAPVLSDSGAAVFSPESPEYAWLDLNAAGQDRSSTGSANYRFVFEFN